MPRQHFHHPTPLGSYNLLIETSGKYLLCDYCVHAMKNQGGRQERYGRLSFAVFQGETSMRGFHLESGLISFCLGVHRCWPWWVASFWPLVVHQSRCLQVADEAHWEGRGRFLKSWTILSPVMILGNSLSPCESQASGKMSRLPTVVFRLFLSSESLSLNNILFRS